MTYVVQLCGHSVTYTVQLCGHWVTYTVQLCGHWVTPFSCVDTQWLTQFSSSDTHWHIFKLLILRLSKKWKTRSNDIIEMCCTELFLEGRKAHWDEGDRKERERERGGERERERLHVGDNTNSGVVVLWPIRFQCVRVWILTGVPCIYRHIWLNVYLFPAGPWPPGMHKSGSISVWHLCCVVILVCRAHALRVHVCLCILIWELM
jgi:hypothetical protein